MSALRATAFVLVQSVSPWVVGGYCNYLFTATPYNSRRSLKKFLSNSFSSNNAAQQKRTEGRKEYILVVINLHCPFPTVVLECCKVSVV